MNILMALSQLEMTGSEVYAATLSNELIRRGHKVYILSDTLTKNTDAKFTKFEFSRRSLINRISHVRFLLDYFKRHNIQIVHAHARAAGWSCSIACRLAKIPMITTSHGRQALHLSRRLFPAFGNHIIAVCENIKEHLIDDLSIDKNKITVIRNGFNTDAFAPNDVQSINKKPLVLLIGRFTGPKGDVAIKLLQEIFEYDKYNVRVIGGAVIPERFEVFRDRADIIGYTKNIQTHITKADLVVGAGRVAIEALLMGKPVVSIGEACNPGLVTESNLSEQMKSNFGDVLPDNSCNYDFEALKKDIIAGLESNDTGHKLRELIVEECDIKGIANKIQKIYKLVING